MNPDDVPTRLARVEQRASDLNDRVNSLMPLSNAVTTNTERVEAMRKDFADFRDKVEEDRDENRRDRRAFIRWAITLTVTIFLALLGAITTIVVTSAHP